LPRLAAIVEPWLTIRRVMRQGVHQAAQVAARRRAARSRLPAVDDGPGVGAVVALTFRATVDQPQRSVHSRAVGAQVGLTPRRHQSGEIDYDGGISKSGDTMLLAMLYEGAQILLTKSGIWSWLKDWGMRVA
jgi:transposase